MSLFTENLQSTNFTGDKTLLHYFNFKVNVKRFYSKSVCWSIRQEFLTRCEGQLELSIKLKIDKNDTCWNFLSIIQIYTFLQDRNKNEINEKWNKNIYKYVYILTQVFYFSYKWTNKQSFWIKHLKKTLITSKEKICEVEQT